MIEAPAAPVTVPLEPTTPIKPSEAIRLGCLIAPIQAFGDWGDEATGKGCAVAAMTLGGYPYLMDGLGVFDVVAAEDCPAGCGDPASLTHLNDDHKWSRERIADWLEGLGL